MLTTGLLNINYKNKLQWKISIITDFIIIIQEVFYT
jgi:hypothetical protein